MADTNIYSQSKQLFEQAQQQIPGGVNSPVRAFHGVGGTPVFFKRADGPYLYDEDDNRYIDYINSWGAVILGHNAPVIREAIEQQLQNGIGFGAPTAIEVTMAALICKHVPSIEKVRMVNSGTEATMSAIRLARAYTKRNKIIKFNGCYHGHADSFLVNAGSGALTFGQPSSPGIPQNVVENTITADYNDLSSVEQLFKNFGQDIAAVIVEPIAGNMNFVLPDEGFLAGLRNLCDQFQSVLIFEEVMTGFRVALGGAQSIYNVKPDMTTLGKVIGGGLPVGAFGGKKDIMNLLAPEGPVYQAGTLSGNPIAMQAGIAALHAVEQAGFFENLQKNTHYLLTEFKNISKKYGYTLTSYAAGGMFGFYFNDGSPIHTLNDVKKCDLEFFQTFFHLCLGKGVYFAPSMYEAGFVSAKHDKTIMDATLNVIDQVLHQMSSR